MYIALREVTCCGGGNLTDYFLFQLSFKMEMQTLFREGCCPILQDSRQLVLTLFLLHSQQTVFPVRDLIVGFDSIEGIQLFLLNNETFDVDFRSRSGLLPG